MTESSVSALLDLRSCPVAVGFLDAEPSDIPKWTGGQMPAGCAFWRKAQNGLTFYTVPSDHYNCAVGAHTHNIPLPEDRASELMATVGFMVQNNYIRMEEVPGIPQLAQGPAAVAFGPVDKAPFTPSLVITALRPAQAMLLFEAVARAGAADAMRTIGRPACAALPLALESGGAAVSLGCKGNRTFTGLPDDEMYVVIPGDKWPAVVAELATIADANCTMEQHYLGHREKFANA